MKYMVDTSAFNLIADGRLSVEQLPAGAELVATYVQVTEINRTRDEERRRRLFLTFAHLRPEIQPTSSFVFGETPLGFGRLGLGIEYLAMKAELDARNNSKSNNSQDALIAETALTERHGLVTADRDLSEVAGTRIANVIYIAF